jgi:hypothetical protein
MSVRQYKLSQFLLEKAAAQIKQQPEDDLTLTTDTDRVVIRRIGKCIILVAGEAEEVSRLLMMRGGA